MRLIATLVLHNKQSTYGNKYRESQDTLSQAMGRNARPQIQCCVCLSPGCVGLAGRKSTATRCVGGNNRERTHVRSSGINRSDVNIESQAAGRATWPEPRAPSSVHVRFPIFITIGGPRECLCLRIAIAATKGLEQRDLSPGPCCHQFQHRICGAVSGTPAMRTAWNTITRAPNAHMGLTCPD